MPDLYCLRARPTTDFLEGLQALIYIQRTYLSPEFLKESRPSSTKTVDFFAYFTDERRLFLFDLIKVVFDQ